MTVTLRPVSDADLPFLFAIQRDPPSNEMADVAPRDADAFAAHWAKIRADVANLAYVIDADGVPAGLVLSFARDGVRELGYWIDRSQWGRGIATRAVAAFLTIDPHRPLVAKVLKDNVGSLRVVERNGFVRTGEVTEGGWYRAGDVGLWVLTLG
jgi:ribosomal-protein-alanine N-acetyltransferase